MTPPADDSLGTILYRLDSIDGRFERMEGRIERLDNGVRSLAYVGVDLYKSEQAAQNEKIDASMKLSMWALGVTCSLVLGVIVTALAKVVAA